MKPLIIISLLTAVISCSSGEWHAVEVTVIRVEKNPDEFWHSCISGMNYTTVAKTTDGRVDSVCDFLGEVGDKVSGYWRTGHSDPDGNGFRANR
jgi:hypothetical protein